MQALILLLFSHPHLGCQAFTIIYSSTPGYQENIANVLDCFSKYLLIHYWTRTRWFAQSSVAFCRYCSQQSGRPVDCHKLQQIFVDSRDDLLNNPINIQNLCNYKKIFLRVETMPPPLLSEKVKAYKKEIFYKSRSFKHWNQSPKGLSSPNHWPPLPAAWYDHDHKFYDFCMASPIHIILQIYHKIYISLN